MAGRIRRRRAAADRARGSSRAPRRRPSPRRRTALPSIVLPTTGSAYVTQPAADGAAQRRRRPRSDRGRSSSCSALADRRPPARRRGTDSSSPASTRRLEAAVDEVALARATRPRSLVGSSCHLPSRELLVVAAAGVGQRLACRRAAWQPGSVMFRPVLRSRSGTSKHTSTPPSAVDEPLEAGEVDLDVVMDRDAAAPAAPSHQHVGAVVERGVDARLPSWPGDGHVQVARDRQQRRRRPCDRVVAQHHDRVAAVAGDLTRPPRCCGSPRSRLSLPTRR